MVQLIFKEAFIMSKVAIIQKPPVLFDRDKTIQSAVALINEAVNGIVGVEIVTHTSCLILKHN